MTIEEILAKDLAIPIVAFANVDGGDIAIGITDKTRRIEGIDFETPKLNELAIHKEKLAIDSEKLTFEKIKVAIENQNYNEPTKNNILKVYKEIEINQVFGAPEIEKILKCSTSTAKNVMKKLREMKVVEVVKGKGKGKYIFVNKSEIC